MNFFKELFKFLFHKNHTLTKKIYTLGAVIVTTCFVSICIMGANGSMKTIYSHTNDKEADSVSEEIEQEELMDNLSLDDELEESFVLPQDEFEFSIYQDYYNFRKAENTAVIKLDKNTEDNVIPLSTAEVTLQVSFSSAELGVEATRDPIVLTQADYEVLLKIVEAEAGGEDLYLRTLIANVVINRMFHEYYPNTIEEVVFQNNGKTYQFTPIKDKRYFKIKVSQGTINAVNEALAGYDNSKGALAFVDPSNTSEKVMNWFNSQLDFVMSYENVSFYTF